MQALLYGRSSCSSPSVFGSKVCNDLIRCKSDGKSQQKSLDLVLFAAPAKKPKRNLIHQNAAERIYSYLSQKWSHPIFIWGVIPAFLFGVLVLAVHLYVQNVPTSTHSPLWWDQVSILNKIHLTYFSDNYSQYVVRSTWKLLYHRLIGCN